MMLALSLLATTAGAQDIFHHAVNDPNTGFEAEIHPDIRGALNAAGSTGIDRLPTVPATLTQYKVVVLSTSFLDSPPVYDVEKFRQFLLNGGFLIVGGDSFLITAAHNNSFNALLSGLGSDLRLVAPVAFETGCGVPATVVNTSNPLMNNVTTFDYAFQSAVDLGADGTALVESQSGDPIVGVQGRIVVFSDLNIYIDECDMNIGNVQFWRNLFLETRLCTDADGDGYDSDCFNLDCNDADPSISPGAIEIWYDGIDQNCDLASDYDQDGDGQDSDQFGGEDCDDTDPLVYVGAPERFYDGIDADCAGDSDFDRDGDGFDGDAEDCADYDPTIFPGATEILDDGIDQDCDGADAVTDPDETIDPTDEGCAGCSSSSVPSSGFLGLALLGLTMVRRRD